MRDSKPQITPTRKSPFTFTYFKTRTIVASTAALVNTPLTRSSGNLVKFDGPTTMVGAARTYACELTGESLRICIYMNNAFRFTRNISRDITRSFTYDFV